VSETSIVLSREDPTPTVETLESVWECGIAAVVITVGLRMRSWLNLVNVTKQYCLPSLHCKYTIVVLANYYTAKNDLLL